jgi:hypothetical protein
MPLFVLPPAFDAVTGRGIQSFAMKKLKATLPENSQRREWNIVGFDRGTPACQPMNQGQRCNSTEESCV